jgi:hypothetical protein
MPATIAELAEKRSTLAESIAKYYNAVIANLDRTPWSHHGAEEKISASQVAVPARVIRKVTERERRERKEREDDEPFRRMDPEVAAFYEEPRLERDREEVPWARERRNLTRAVLKGAPGGGKTFLAQTTALDLAREGQQQLASRATELDRLPLPIMVELKRLGVDKLPDDFGEALIEVLAKHYPVRGRLEAWIARKLRTADCWLILDGLDEVGSARDQVGPAESHRVGGLEVPGLGDLPDSQLRRWPRRVEEMGGIRVGAVGAVGHRQADRAVVWGGRRAGTASTGGDGGELFVAARLPVAAAGGAGVRSP